MKDFFKQLFKSSADEIEIEPVDIENAVRKKITVSGRVQGVGFRFFTKTEAAKLHLTGWVKNLSNGAVTMEVQGAVETIEELVEILKRGNGFSKVTNLEMQDLSVVAEEKTFAITY